MPRVSKHKQHLTKIAPLVIESNKRRKTIKHIEADAAFQIRQRLDKDFWDEYECALGDDFSSDDSSFEKELEEEEEDDENQRKEQDEKKQEDPPKSVFTPGIGNTPGAGNYLRGIRGTGSLSTEKRKRRKIRALAKAALGSHSIVTMFAAHQPKISEGNIAIHSSPLSSLPKIPENKEKIKTQAALDLTVLMRLKTEQIKKYGVIFNPQSDLYRRYQMVQSFLWMQSRRNQDNPRVKRCDLATIVAQRFNRGQYTGRRIIHWEKEWINTRRIAKTKAGKHKHALSWMDHKDLILAIKTWAKDEGDSQYSHIYY